MLQVLRHVKAELDKLPYVGSSTATGQAAPQAAAAGAAGAPDQHKQQQQQEGQAQVQEHGQPKRRQQQQQRGKGHDQRQGGEVPGGGMRVMLLCGADLLETMAIPGVWVAPDLVLQEHGVVCVDREGTDLQRLLQRGAPTADGGGGSGDGGSGDGSSGNGIGNGKGSGDGAGGSGGAGASGVAEGRGVGTDLLCRHRDKIIVVQDPVPNSISSTTVRGELEAGRSAAYLAPDAVLRYARQHGLYCGGGTGS